MAFINMTFFVRQCVHNNFNSSTHSFDKLLDKATSHLLMEPDWPAITQLCDLISEGEVSPQYILFATKKKLLFLKNQHAALYALLVIESIIKNGGYQFRDREEPAVRNLRNTLYELASITPHKNIRQKAFELIRQTWHFAFPKRFSEFSEFEPMFRAQGQLWLSESVDGDVCHRCRTIFGKLRDKFHCRACERVFCSQCTQKTTTLPKCDIKKEVRVCDACYDHATKASAASKAAAEKQESELPPEYLNNSLAQQSQASPRKSDEELREEEELQLAIAISLSEVAAKEKEKEAPSTTVHERVAFENFNSFVAQETQALPSSLSSTSDK